MSSIIKKRIAFVTYKNFHFDFNIKHASQECPWLTKSDNEVRKFLEKNNFKCEPMAWDDKSIQSLNFDLFVIRSAWNYYYSKSNLNKFLNFINLVRGRVYNPEPAISWNFNKKYLLDLKKKGIPIVPTIFLNHINDLKIDAIRKIGREIVIKPCISGAGRNTYHINLEEENTKKFDKIKKIFLQSEMPEVMVQPFINSILEKGELSLIFFADNFSHAIQKIPLADSFYTHTSIIRIDYVPLEAIALAKKTLFTTYQILDLPFGSLLYARIDLLFDSNKGYLISELEIIEPELFLQGENDAIKKFGEAIINIMH